MIIIVIIFTYNVGCADSPEVVGPYKIMTVPTISSGVSDEENAPQSHGMCTWHHTITHTILCLLKKWECKTAV